MVTNYLDNLSRTHNERGEEFVFRNLSSISEVKLILNTIINIQLFLIISLITCLVTCLATCLIIGKIEKIIITSKVEKIIIKGKVEKIIKGKIKKSDHLGVRTMLQNQLQELFHR